MVDHYSYKFPHGQHRVEPAGGSPVLIAGEFSGHCYITVRYSGGVRGHAGHVGGGQQ